MAERIGDGGVFHSLRDWCARLHGEIGRDEHGDEVIRCPGPGHSPGDRSLSVWLDPDAPQGFRVHSFADDDFAMLRDYVRDTCHAPEFKPAKAKANGHAKPARQVVEHYVYQGPDGEPVQRVTRYYPKAFSQSRPVGSGWEPGGIPNKRRVPYRLPEIIEAIGLGRIVYVLEGERAVQRAWEVGLPATCSSGGAGKWSETMSPWFAGAQVIILPDADTPGRKHAEQVRESLEPVAEWVRIVNLPGLPPGGDLVDWLQVPGNNPATIPDIRPGPPARGHTAEALWDMPFPPIKFAVPGYIAEGLTLLAGAPKRGKSWLALDLCCSVALGGFTLGDQKCIEGDCLYCALEDSPRRIKERLHKVLQLSDHAPRRLVVWFGGDLPRLGNGCEEALREWITSQPDPRLIVIDTLNYIRPDRSRDEDPYSYDYRSAIPLHLLAQEFGIAIILVHHTRKTPSDDYLEAVSGTNGLTGGSDALIVLEKGSDGGHILKGRGRDVEEFETAIRFEKDECRWRVMGDATEARLSETRKAILTVLKEAGWFMSAGEIAQQTGRKANTIHQQLFQMLKAGQVVRAGRGKYGLPPEVFTGNPGSREDDDD